MVCAYEMEGDSQIESTYAQDVGLMEYCIKR